MDAHCISEFGHVWAKTNSVSLRVNAASISGYVTADYIAQLLRMCILGRTTCGFHNGMSSHPRCRRDAADELQIAKHITANCCGKVFRVGGLRPAFSTGEPIHPNIRYP